MRPTVAQQSAKGGGSAAYIEKKRQSAEIRYKIFDFLCYFDVGAYE
jgi:hypothetical protein